MADTEAPRVLVAPGRSETEVRRSRFFGHAAPVTEDGDCLREFLAAVRAEHREAGHVVYGWRGPGGRRRSSDDGEPHGTGGRPCLQVLDHAGVVGAAVAVARVFGGTLLGVGGLGRAYGDAAGRAIRAAGIRTLIEMRDVVVRARFADEASVRPLLDAFPAPPGQRYTAAGVEFAGALPTARVAALGEALDAATSGRARLEETGPSGWR